MKFGEKLKKLRKDRKLRQVDLADDLKLSTRTIVSYEKGTSYPKNREIYNQLASYFRVDVNYLLMEDEDFTKEAKNIYGSVGKYEAEDLVDKARALFAGGELEEEDKDAVMKALQEAYWDAKRG